MKFAQIIELKTSRWEELRELDEEWLEQTEGMRPRSVEFYAADRDRPNTYIAVVQWDSYEAAMANNDLPATEQIARRMSELCDEPPTYRNLDVLVERL
jgi:quinol monooxygenase YgiN